MNRALTSVPQTFKTTDGTRLAYVVDDFTDPWRPPETIILLHSAMSSARRLYAWVPHLAREWRVVRLDLRGHGQSEVPAPERPLTLERLVQDVIELLDHLDCPRVHLAGSSAGAIVALKVAIDHPERLLTLGAFATTPGLKPSNIDAARWIAMIGAQGLRGFLGETIADRFDVATADPGLVQWFLDEASRTDVPFLARWVTLMKSVDLTAELGRIRCPTLAVVPGHDPLGSPAQYEVLRERILDVEFVVYQDLPHNITDAAADRCAEELRGFLRRRRGSG
jgi:pimeloyl-ACP methyl ester carboxylesterase